MRVCLWRPYPGCWRLRVRPGVASEPRGSLELPHAQKFLPQEPLSQAQPDRKWFLQGPAAGGRWRRPLEKRGSSPFTGDAYPGPHPARQPPAPRGSESAVGTLAQAASWRTEGPRPQCHRTLGAWPEAQAERSRTRKLEPRLGGGCTACPPSEGRGRWRPPWLSGAPGGVRALSSRGARSWCRESGRRVLPGSCSCSWRPKYAEPQQGPGRPAGLGRAVATRVSGGRPQVAGRRRGGPRTTGQEL